MSASECKVIKTEPLPESEARWTKLVKTTYTDPHGKERTWEHGERTTRPSGCLIDGVGILTILQHPTGPHILLQKQFRAPTSSVCIEIPAGLIDANETAEECAVRELLEETGYHGKAVETSPIMFNDPGFCNTNLKMVHVEVDLEDERNKDPKPRLEEGEFIECFSVPLTSFWEEIQRLEREGFAIDARVGTLAEGIEVAKRWKLFG